MNYETSIKEGQHLKILLTLTKLTKEEPASRRKDFKQLLDGHIFCPISKWLPSITEILEHNTITDKNTFKLILFAYGYGISPKVCIQYLYTFILNISSNAKKRTQLMYWIVTKVNTHQTSGTILAYITDLPSFSTVPKRTKVRHPRQVLDILHHLLYTTQQYKN